MREASGAERPGVGMSKKGRSYAKILSEKHIARFGITKSAGSREALEAAYLPYGEAAAVAIPAMKQAARLMEEAIAMRQAIIDSLQQPSRPSPKDIYSRAFVPDEWEIKPRDGMDLAGGN